MSKISKAVIVAAGISSRLYPLTLNLPKVLLEVAGETIVGRSVRLLGENGIKEILIVVGCQKDLIQKALEPFVADVPHIHYQFNPFFAETNNMGSLWFAKEWVKDHSFLYLHGDLVYDPELLRSFMSGTYADSALLVDCGSTDEEAMKVRVKDGRFIESSKDIPLDEAFGEWIGMIIFTRPQVLFDKIEILLEQKNFQGYDTLAFTEMAGEGTCFSVVPTCGRPWIEIDFESELDQGRQLFR